MELCLLLLPSRWLFFRAAESELSSATTHQYCRVNLTLAVAYTAGPWENPMASCIGVGPIRKGMICLEPCHILLTYACLTP